jgi:hypothetical protein
MTVEIIDEANVWWGGAGAPISVSDMSEHCDDYIKAEDE